MINVNMTDKAGVTLATAGKYCADNVKVTPSAEILRKDEQAKTATPTTSAQDITPDAGKALSKVTVKPITAAIVGDLDADSFASAIVAAIEGKGVDVPDGAKLDALAALVESIEAGGGGSKVVTGTITFTDETTNAPYKVTHNMGAMPSYIIYYPITTFGVTDAQGANSVVSAIATPTHQFGVHYGGASNYGRAYIVSQEVDWTKSSSTNFLRSVNETSFAIGSWGAKVFRAWTYRWLAVF